MSESENILTSERWLEFKLANMRYAVPLLSVREVLAVPQTTPVANSPKHYVGMMNIRGQILNLVSLAKKIGLQEAAANEQAAVIISIIGSVHVGFLVDAIDSVFVLDPQLLSNPPESEKQADYVKGVYRRDDGLVLLLDIGSALGLAAQEKSAA